MNFLFFNFLGEWKLKLKINFNLSKHPSYTRLIHLYWLVWLGSVWKFIFNKRSDLMYTFILTNFRIKWTYWVNWAWRNTLCVNVLKTRRIMIILPNLMKLFNFKDVHFRKFAILERNQLTVKKDYILFIQNSLRQGTSQTAI